jgi:hypothetical protein
MDLSGVDASALETLMTTRISDVSKARDRVLGDFGIRNYLILDSNHKTIQDLKNGNREVYFIHSRYKGMLSAVVQMVERQYVADHVGFQVVYFEDSPALENIKKIDSLLDNFRPVFRPNRSPASELVSTVTGRPVDANDVGYLRNAPHPEDAPDPTAGDIKTAEYLLKRCDPTPAIINGFAKLEQMKLANQKKYLEGKKLEQPEDPALESEEDAGLTSVVFKEARDAVQNKQYAARLVAGTEDASKQVENGELTNGDKIISGICYALQLGLPVLSNAAKLMAGVRLSATEARAWMAAVRAGKSPGKAGALGERVAAAMD